MNTGIYVFENRPRWVPELKRQFIDDPVAIRVCPRVQDLTHIQQLSSESLFVLALQENANVILNLLKWKNRHRMEIPVIVIAGKRWMSLEWSLREAGIIAFTSEQISGSQLARLCRRIVLRSQTNHTS